MQKKSLTHLFEKEKKNIEKDHVTNVKQPQTCTSAYELSFELNDN